MSHCCSTISPRSFHPLPHHSPNVCPDRWLWNASVAWLISRRTCKKIAFRKFPQKKGEKNTSNKPTCFSHLEKTRCLMMMFQEGISFWKCHPGSFFIFFQYSIGSNETSTESDLASGRPWRRRWMPCGSCDTRVSYASSVPAYNLRCCWWLRTGGCHGAPREAVKNWIAWVFCSQKTWDSLRKVWRTFALPCGILSWISQGKMLEFENGHTKYTKILSVWRSLLGFFTGTRHVEPHNAPTKMPLLKTKTFIPYTSKKTENLHFPKQQPADISWFLWLICIHSWEG